MHPVGTRLPLGKAFLHGSMAHRVLVGRGPGTRRPTDRLPRGMTVQPSQRVPTHPGEILLEEFLVPLEASDARVGQLRFRCRAKNRVSSPHASAADSAWYEARSSQKKPWSAPGYTLQWKVLPSSARRGAMRCT